MAVQMRLIHKCLSWWQCNLSHVFLLVHSGHVKIDDFFRVLRLKACSFTERVSCEVLCINFSCNILIKNMNASFIFGLTMSFPSLPFFSFNTFDWQLNLLFFSYFCYGTGETCSTIFMLARFIVCLI